MTTYTVCYTDEDYYKYESYFFNKSDARKFIKMNKHKWECWELWKGKEELLDGECQRQNRV